MEGNSKFGKCNDNDVIECNDFTYKVAKLKKALAKVVENEEFVEQFWYLLREEKINYLEDGEYDIQCFTEGMDAQILTLGSQSWKKGKLKFQLNVEFYVEEEDAQIKEPESPLDDLRRMINETTS